MKTVGEILKSTRLARKLTIDQTEKDTKIRKKYLEAIENDQWYKLPSTTYVQGFIKNYAAYLGLDLKLVLAIFRRQKAPDTILKVLPTGLVNPLDKPFWQITPTKILSGFVIFLIFLFFSWLFWQYQSFVWAPKIQLDKPLENEIIKGTSVAVIGKTDPWAKLTINGQEVKLNDGHFSQEISVGSGSIVINIAAVNKFGKKQELRRTIQVENPMPIP